MNHRLKTFMTSLEQRRWNTETIHFVRETFERWLEGTPEELGVWYGELEHHAEEAGVDFYEVCEFFAYVMESQTPGRSSLFRALAERAPLDTLPNQSSNTSPLE
ncbi:MAG TPA: hypothetical protein ENK18_03730 [Deltaproteobacteria bacterium]|nr:hypothetical protein [Deltaproteobacteria bacterium]